MKSNNFLIKIKNSFYGISKFGTKVQAICNNYSDQVLKFEIRMFNFKGKSLPEDKVYIYKNQRKI